MHSYTVNNVG